MDRHAFLKKSLSACAACGIVSVPVARGQDPPKPEDAAASFREAWVKNFLKNLDAELDGTGRSRFMESCGRDCARNCAVKMAESFKGDMDGMVAAMSGHLGKDNIVREGNRVVLKYPECYCPMVSKIRDKLYDTWCNCSRGWVLEMFETVTGKQVQATLVSSIKRGDAVCRFDIDV